MHAKCSASPLLLILLSLRSFRSLRPLRVLQGKRRMQVMRVTQEGMTSGQLEEVLLPVKMAPRRGPRPCRRTTKRDMRQVVMATRAARARVKTVRRSEHGAG